MVQKNPIKPVPEALSMGEVRALGERYGDPEIRCLFYLLYLTGCRITEALNVRRCDIIEDKSVELGKYLRVRLITLKNRRQKLREIPILMNENEGPMVTYILDYISDMAEDQNIFSIKRTNAWNYLAKTEITVRAIKGTQIIDNYSFKIHPHYCRHCRLTHLVRYYNYDMTRLMRFAGWSNPNMAQIYIHLDWMDLAKPMRNGGELI